MLTSDELALSIELAMLPDPPIVPSPTIHVHLGHPRLRGDRGSYVTHRKVYDNVADVFMYWRVGDTHYIAHAWRFWNGRAEKYDMLAAMSASRKYDEVHV